VLTAFTHFNMLFIHRLHTLYRLLLLCYISTAVYVLQDMTNGTFEFTNKEHWIDLLLTLTFTSQFTSKYFFPRSNGVLWYMGFIIISCIISFPVLHAAMRKVGTFVPYAIATVVSAVVRYYGVLYYPDLQLSAIHHPISSSFMGFLGTIAAGMVCYHLTVKANNMCQSLSITAKCRTVVLRWSLFAIGYGVISYMAYRRDVMHKKGWFRHIDSSSWHSFVLQGSYIDIALEAALITMFLSLGMHSRVRFLPEMILSMYPLVLCGAATFSIFIFHFR
jgi:hypothetical protein